jgi:EF-P beta-lysylation protein EpmB
VWRAAWQQELAEAVRDVDELCARLQLPTTMADQARRAMRDFPLLVPQSYLNRMRPGDLHDPLLQQVLPIDVELDDVAGYLRDPVGDTAAERAPGLLQKYTGRGLLITTGACAVHCRYCFRRHYPYETAPRTLEAWEPTLQVMRADPTLHEALLSGGDPLTLTDQRLGDLLGALEEIPHLTRVRIHTRLPIVIPSRITPGLLQRLRDSRLTPYMVVHANHPQELTGDCAAALRLLVRSGITSLNQAVLLRGVNDNMETMAGLSERLIDLGVLPYYLNQLDPVAGSAHFHVPIAQGLQLIEDLRRLLPGYAVPRYVQEIAGEPQKTPLSPSDQKRSTAKPLV